MDVLHGREVPDPYRWLEDGDSAEVSENIYQRYVKSFTHPIPDTFKRDQDTQFMSGGGRSQ